MRPCTLTMLLLAASLSGCWTGDVVTVRVLPSYYELGGMRSELATPIVDEALRLKPSEVRMHACYTTPATKVIQFQTELAARYKGKIGLAFFEKSECPA